MLKVKSGHRYQTLAVLHVRQREMSKAASRLNTISAIPVITFQSQGTAIANAHPRVATETLYDAQPLTG